MRILWQLQIARARFRQRSCQRRSSSLSRAECDWNKNKVKIISSKFYFKKFLVLCRWRVIYTSALIFFSCWNWFNKFLIKLISKKFFLISRSIKTEFRKCFPLRIVSTNYCIDAWLGPLLKVLLPKDSRNKNIEINLAVDVSKAHLACENLYHITFKMSQTDTKWTSNWLEQRCSNTLSVSLKSTKTKSRIIS